MFQVPEFRVSCFFWYIPSTCYPVLRCYCSVSSTCARNVSLFSLYFKYLHACQCPTILSITTGRAGWAWMVLYGAGRPSLTSIFYTLYFASIAVFNIPASHTFSVFDVFHFTVFFAVVFHVYTCVQNIFLLSSWKIFTWLNFSHNHRLSWLWRILSKGETSSQYFQNMTHQSSFWTLLLPWPSEISRQYFY